MKYLIALLTAATGILHLLIGFGVLPAAGITPTSWLLVANGAGYLVLLVLYWTATGNHNTIRWILLAYTFITLVGYFIIGAGFNGGTWPLVIKAIELLLIILLLFDRGTVKAAAPAAAARASTPAVPTRSVDVPSASATMGSMAAGASAGAATVAAGAAVMADRTAEMTDDVVDTADDVVDEAGDMVHDGAMAVAGTADAAMDKVDDVMDTEAADLDAAQMAAEPTAEEVRAQLEEYLRSFGPSSEFRKEIEYVEGIGPAYGQKLRAVGVATVMDLLVNGATRRGRKHLSEQSGVAQSMILTWVNHVDLFRIKGVAQEYADLLEQSGVDTVVELGQRNPANLHKRMADINEQKKLVRRLPHASDVDSWVAQAKTLQRVIHY